MKHLKEETIDFMNNKRAELRRSNPESVTGSLQKQQVLLKKLPVRNSLLFSLCFDICLAHLYKAVYCSGGTPHCHIS